MKKNKYHKNPKPIKEYQKRNIWKILNQKENMKKDTYEEKFEQEKIAKMCIKNV